jgi:hypothetical protein
VDPAARQDRPTHLAVAGAVCAALMVGYESLWPGLPAALLFALAWLDRRHLDVRLYRAFRGQCARCGYDLRARPGRCPGCGAIANAE